MKLQKSIENDEITKKNAKLKNMLPIGQLFRYATVSDKLMMLLGTLGALGSGTSYPVMMIVFTNIIKSFINTDYCGYSPKLCIPSNFSATSIDFKPPDIDSLTILTTTEMKKQAFYLVVIALCTMVFSFLQVNFWMIPAEKQTLLIRKYLFKSILRQDLSWFDTNKSGELQNRLNDDVNKIKLGLGDKFGSTLQFTSSFLTGTIIAFYRGWKLTLVILSLSPLLVAVGYGFTKISAYLSTNELKSYAKAGSITEEVLSSIRTIFAFNGAQKEHKRYESELEVARKFGIKKSATTGLMLGIVWILVNSTFALSFWYGWTLTRKDPLNNCLSELNIGEIMLVFFSVILAVFSLGQAAPFMEKLAEARSAAYEIYKIIDRIPHIDIESNKGLKLNSIQGEIRFRNVSFNYPSRKDVQVLDGFDIDIQSGTTIALVGSSGCGKSTCIQLIQRFYDLSSGAISIDGHDIRELNLSWLRSQIGVVNQEPILFDMTIADNIRFGRCNSPHVTQVEIEEAAKQANAHDFIMQLPQKYETIVGSRGSQLSGGQKQRIAIARALVRNPKILLLDEATSALDNESESIVQSALEMASKGRTTVIVAHRLSTIRNVNKIYVVEKGCILESGTHDELMSKQGHFCSLVSLQETSNKQDNEKTDESNSQLVFFNEKLPNETRERTRSIIDSIFSSQTLKQQEKNSKYSMKSVIELNKPEYFYIFLGAISSLISGAIMPAFAIVLSKLTAAFRECDYEVQKTLVTRYCLLLFGFGLMLLVTYFFQGLMFGISGENLTKRIRSKLFKSILSQEVAWFDEPSNSVGTLCTRLSNEAAAVKGATGHSIGFFMLNIGNLGIGIAISFGYSWPVTLLILGFIPFIAASAILQSKLVGGFSDKDKSRLEEAGKLASEAISNIRTVAVLNVEKKFYDIYSNRLDTPYRASIRSSHLYSIMYGFTNSIMFYAIAASFSLGAYLIDNKLFNSDITNILVVFNCVTFGAQSAGTASTFMPDAAQAKVAAMRILEMFARKSKINNFENNEGVRIDSKTFDGSIQFSSISFTYPTRPNVQILKDFSFKLNAGERIALVGSSGCGKSTITQLLERFYDANHGEIRLNDKSIKDLNLFSLRSHIGIVSQEPILFDTTIASNISYGCDRELTQEELEDVARKANIHEFICKLPQGYQTNVGSKGTQLSGGQKQRIAIARALILSPKILLLDEATSALDTESEKIVQDALDRAQEGRTCIIIAHRLSTIKNADKILVLKDGNIVEAGKHEQLMKNENGIYFKLYNQK